RDFPSHASSVWNAPARRGFLSLVQTRRSTMKESGVEPPHSRVIRKLNVAVCTIFFDETPMSTAPLAAAERYFKEAITRLPALLEGQRPELDRAAALCTDAIASEGLVH